MPQDREPGGLLQRAGRHLGRRRATAQAEDAVVPPAPGPVARCLRPIERPEGAAMRKVIVNEWMSLDGIVQALGATDEDTTGDFKHGGWHLRYFDELSQNWVVEGYAEAGGFLFGRRTFEN